MQAVAQHMNAGAELARRMAAGRMFDTTQSRHPESRATSG
jgi:hypothetical protein